MVFDGGRIREKKGFWEGLFGPRNSAVKEHDRSDKSHGRRASEGGAKPAGVSGRVAKSSAAQNQPPSSGSGSRRQKGKGREQDGTDYKTGPLASWPPRGMRGDEEVTLGRAMELISRGVPIFRGHKRAIPHASDHYYAMFGTTAGTVGDETDAANMHDAMIQLMTLKLSRDGKGGTSSPSYPWETLEQPSFAFWFGRRPGCVTLNCRVAGASMIPPVPALRDSGFEPRVLELDGILKRLKELERGLEDDDEELMYRNLYKRLLRDPDRARNPHMTLDKQLTDLIMVLSRPEWIDFTVPKNQVVTRFIYNPEPLQYGTYTKFLHQLLLSVELEARINSKHHLPEARDKLLSALPPTIQWDLAVARRWRDNVRVEAYGKTPDQTRLRFKLKKRQIKMLKRFAQMMKWPNLADTLHSLRRRDAESCLDAISSDCTAFFSGLVLPGRTFPFLMMNSLIDVDPDQATDDLALLTHLHPHCGFQYRNSYTYWTAESIVGKVLAPTCRAVAGWTGPARPTPDLAGNQIARVRSRRNPRHRQQPSAEDVGTMSERSDPLGPPAHVYPIRDYALVVPPGNSDATNNDGGTVKTELLTLVPCPDSSGRLVRGVANQPGWFDAGVHFSVGGARCTLKLAYNVDFVSAWPCSEGPHPLFFDYAYEVVRAEELMRVGDWDAGSFCHSPSSSGGAFANGGRKQGEKKVTFVPVQEEDAAGDANLDKVLAVEASGTSDREVLARAWCAHWGLGAVVADLGRTCMACAIRETYAVKLTVVILVDGDSLVNGPRS